MPARTRPSLKDSYSPTLQNRSKNKMRQRRSMQVLLKPVELSSTTHFLISLLLACLFALLSVRHEASGIKLVKMFFSIL
ncbi:hypothetical protein Ciccas_004273 [Cichlidogyrus casuarinus]|uniref:Transmembrane protein n=1 Tax=Cichlidogyrus casuarinus TaxID=1844966 RepID=A0ABD2QBY4_9PLAT